MKWQNILIRLRKLMGILMSNRSPKQVALKNSFWLFLAHGVSKVFKFFLVIFAARILGPEGYGGFNYTVSILTLLFTASELGVEQVLIREYQKADVDKAKLLATTFVMKMGLIIGSGLLALGYAQFSSDALVGQIFFVLLAMVIVDSIKLFLVSIVRANNRMEFESGAFIAETVFTTVFGLMALFYTQSIFYFACAYLAGSSIAFLLILPAVGRFFSLKNIWGSVDVRYGLLLLGIGIPLMISNIARTFMSTTDMVLIKWFLDHKEVGYYSASL
ncbi:MAG: O-antigen/teichoic acid export membrane protein, partial [Candidatus Marinamargulisbacteria bacterium]